MYPISEFIAELGDIPVAVDAASIRRKSRDYYSVSPMLRATLDGKRADAVVSPRSTEEVARTVAAAVRHKIPITERGTGTANYGQSVPLHGGIMLDMSGLAGILWIRPGAVRALAGTRIEAIERAARGDRLGDALLSQHAPARHHRRIRRRRHGRHRQHQLGRVARPAAISRVRK